MSTQKQLEENALACFRLNGAQRSFVVRPVCVHVDGENPPQVFLRSPTHGGTVFVRVDDDDFQLYPGIPAREHGPESLTPCFTS